MTYLQAIGSGPGIDLPAPHPYQNTAWYLLPGDLETGICLSHMHQDQAFPTVQLTDFAPRNNNDSEKLTKTGQKDLPNLPVPCPHIPPSAQTIQEFAYSPGTRFQRAVFQPPQEEAIGSWNHLLGTAL